MAFVVIWRSTGGDLRRSHAFTGLTAVADAHFYAIAKTPPEGFAFHAIASLESR